MLLYLSYTYCFWGIIANLGNVYWTIYYFSNFHLKCKWGFKIH